MLSTSAISTFTYSDQGFYTLEKTLKSICSDKLDSAPTKLTVSVGRSDSILKSTKSNLDTTCSPEFLRAMQKTSELCNDIEYNFTTAINALGDCVWDVPSPVCTGRKGTEFVIDANGNRKRFRRKPQDLEGEKTHTCPYVECEKSYTSRCSLYLHIKRNHVETECLKEGETAPIWTNSKVKKGVNIHKVFKPAQAQKYNCGATNLSTANSISADQSSESPVKEIRLEKTKSICERRGKFSQEIVPKREISKTKKATSAHNFNLVDLDYEVKCEFAAEVEIFSWEAYQESDRKASVTSIFVQEPTYELENVIEEEAEVYGQNFVFPYNIEYHEDEAIVMDDFCLFKNEFQVNDCESDEYARDFDLIDFSIKQEYSDCCSLFEFEFEVNGIFEPRKALKI